jgi:hypothetical protein
MPFAACFLRSAHHRTMKKLPSKTRVIIDAKGFGRREIEVAPGKWKAELGMDTAQLRVLDPSKIPSASNHATRVPGLTPYGDTKTCDKSIKQRSRLDYMRALSEDIKRKRKNSSD